MSKIQLKGISLILFVLLVACSQKGSPQAATSPAAPEKVVVPGGSYENINPQGLSAMLQNKDFTLVNVHIPFEGDLPDTDISIPYNEIDQHLDQLPGKEAKIVLYCRSGRMSEIAAKRLVELGYQDIWNLDGGMVAWEQAGLPVKQ